MDLCKGVGARRGGYLFRIAKRKREAGQLRRFDVGRCARIIRRIGCFRIRAGFRCCFRGGTGRCRIGRFRTFSS